MDFLKLEPSQGRIENIVVVTISRNMLRHMQRKIRQQGQLQRFYLRMLWYITAFQNGCIATKTVILKVKQLRSCVSCREFRKAGRYHPMRNGITEQFNSTLLNMMGTLEPVKKLDWKSHIGPLVHDYNCTKHDTTEYAPYFLMFGRHPRIPVDLVLGRQQKVITQSVGSYVATLRQRLQEAYELATSVSRDRQAGQKKGYDRKVRSTILCEGIEC